MLIIAINEVNERMHVKQEMFCLCETLLRVVIILFDLLSFLIVRTA
jgi:hypothetical protein